MAKTTFSRKQPQRPSVITNTLSKANDGFQDVTQLFRTLDDIGPYIKQFAPHNPALKEKVLSLQRILEEIAREELTSPINDWQDFIIRLAQVERAYKRARFDSNLKSAAQNLYAFLSKIKKGRDESIEYWKAHTLLYELNDIFHLETDINQDAMIIGKKIQYELQQLSDEWDKRIDITQDLRRLNQEKVIYCAYRGIELKRSGETEEAKKLFEWLLKFTVSKLLTSKLPCLGVQANLTYNLGSIYRILEQHDRAEDMYTQSLNFLREKLKWRGENDIDDHILTVRKQAMAVGIGFGWINLTRGFLRRAENALTTARSLLARSTDPIVPPYIELLYGTIKRCRAGTDAGQLREAIDSLQNAHRAFEEHGHSRYIPRACWELSLAFNLLGEDDEAKDYLEVVSKYAEQTGHPKWQTNVSILRSRMLRRQGDCQGALSQANSAVRKAESCNSILPLIDAYITRGEANLCIVEESTQHESNYSLARSDFEKALRFLLDSDGNGRAADLPSNPKIAAVCNLRIAQCHARERDEAKAKEFFAAWEALRSNVEHGWVRELADHVKGEIDILSMNFTISAKDLKEWDYADNVAKLRRWLLTQALRQTKKNFSEAANLIGVQRATLYQWQESSRSQSKRARTNGNGKLSKKSWAD